MTGSIRDGTVVYQATAERSPDAEPEDGIVAVLLDGVEKGRIQKRPDGDAYVFYESGRGTCEWTIEGNNIAALKERVEAWLLG